MNLYDATLARYGPRVRQTGLVRRMSSIGSSKKFRELTDAYLIDETKVNYVTPEEAAKGTGDYVRKVLLGLAPLRPGVDYQPGKSKVWSFGSANHPIYLSHPNPFAMPDRERLERVVEAWLKDRAKAQVKAHHLVFSIDTRLTAALAQKPATKALPLDDLLLDCVTNALLEYQSNFYPRDQLGVLAGIHHDKHHAHAHVLVHPMTASGRRVNLSTNEREIIDGKEVNVLYQEHLKASFSRQTDQLSDYCFGPAQDFTWVGRAPSEDDRVLAREEMVLAGRANDEPEADEGDTPEAAIAGRLKARRKLLSLGNYPQLIRRARQAQRQQVDASIASGEEPEYVEPNFAGLVTDLESASAKVSRAASTVTAMFGEFERSADRPGPCLLPECGLAVSRSSAFKHLRESDAAPLPTPMTVPAFLRRRSARHADVAERMSESVSDYAKAGREYAQSEMAQHVRLADSAALLLAYSGEVTGFVPEYLQESLPRPIRLPDEALVQERVTRGLHALSEIECSHFQPANPTVPPGEPRAVRIATSAPTAETAFRITPMAFPSSLARVSDGVPDAPEAWLARRRSIVTPDI